MKFKPQISMEINQKGYSYKLLDSLEKISKTLSQRRAAKELKISHSVLNRRIKNSEKKLGFELIKVIGSKSYLTTEAIQILEQYQKYKGSVAENDKIAIAGGHIITGLLDSISDELPFEIDVYSSSDINAYKLAKKGFVDFLALDDPQIAFLNDLDFTPIAYDYLVLVSNDVSKERIANLKDLNDLNFISVNGSSQRFAWNTLHENNVSFNIIQEVKSELDAFKIVKNSQNLYTFLNASYFKGNNVLKDETKHVISLVQTNTSKKETNEFIEYILGKGQKLIANQGFTPIKPWKISK
ncbi:MAG: LysR family transcriptional regulator [Methanobrevibacter sp.]|nr:LysR family transcriptional regulator [Methanobrevibacter sp.]